MHCEFGVTGGGAHHVQGWGQELGMLHTSFTTLSTSFTFRAASAAGQGQAAVPVTLNLVWDTHRNG